MWGNVFEQGLFWEISAYCAVAIFDLPFLVRAIGMAEVSRAGQGLVVFALDAAVQGHRGEEKGLFLGLAFDGRHKPFGTLILHLGGKEKAALAVDDGDERCLVTPS